MKFSEICKPIKLPAGISLLHWCEYLAVRSPLDGGKTVTAIQIFNYSPSGELFMLFEWFENCMIGTFSRGIVEETVDLMPSVQSGKLSRDAMLSFCLDYCNERRNEGVAPFTLEDLRTPHG